MLQVIVPLRPATRWPLFGASGPRQVHPVIGMTALHWTIRKLRDYSQLGTVNVGCTFSDSDDGEHAVSADEAEAGRRRGDGR